MNAPNRIGRSLATIVWIIATQGAAKGEDTARWSWQEPQARVMATGDLAWAPTRFAFALGASIRYIDFDSGSDANDGRSKVTPWKHHPWDPEARGTAAACKGVHTYVFKPGVDYRGELHANESESEGSPIVLTREWAFCPIAAEPARILDEHWCMSPYYTVRDDYYMLPTYPLRGVNVSLNDYESGPLENWTTGALRLNGRDQYAVLAHADIDRSVTMRGERGTPERTLRGDEVSSPQIHTFNLLIEAHLKTARGENDATLIQKSAGAGFSLSINEVGSVTLSTHCAGRDASVESRAAVNDGRWHHVIAEADRTARTLTIYVDGKLDARGLGLDAEASLASNADMHVGGTPDGHHLEGAIDFLRIARGTLADARTTIEELHAWQFHGPFLDDFTGRKRPADGGNAGSIDGER